MYQPSALPGRVIPRINNANNTTYGKRAVNQTTLPLVLIPFQSEK